MRIRAALFNLALTALTCSACVERSPPPSLPLTPPPRRGPVHVLSIRHSAKPESLQLAPGSYVVEARGQSYAATCRFRAPSDRELRAGSPEWQAQCTGDELGVLGDESASGFLVPASLSAIQVRVVRDGVVIFDGVVTAHTSCDVSGPNSGPERLCIFIEEDLK